MCRNTCGEMRRPARDGHCIFAVLTCLSSRLPEIFTESGHGFFFDIEEKMTGFYPGVFPDLNIVR